MAALTSLAKPYAKAAFDYAQEQQALAAWQVMLQSLGVITANKAMRTYIGNPDVSNQQVVELLLSLAQSKMAQNGENFVRLLVEHQRINVLPAIATLFDRYIAQLEQKVDVSVATAHPMTPEQETQLSQALEKRFAKQINLHCEIDANLLGGAVIKADDLVIDGSAHGRLKQLQQQLMKT